MGKFTGVLIASDFDNTLVYTENALKGLEPMPDLLPENRAAIEYFMAEGGIFSVATGRALPAFEMVRRDLPKEFSGALWPFRKEIEVITSA